jgi:DNA polymerase-1
MQQRKKLFLLDGMALVYRAYFAFSKNPRITSYGFNTSAIFGYVNTLLDVLKKEKPTHIGVSFDTAAPTARHDEYEHYKAHRDEQPEDITKALPYILKVTEAMRIPLLIRDGFEADDIIGTLAKKAEQQGFDVYMMTPDKDFGQLVSGHIFIYKPARMGNDFEILGVPEVLKRWEITDIKQVIDILGMWGDAVDNIPGIPGIGEKTAKLLVQKYGSMEGLYEHLDELKGKQKENVINFKEQAFLSKRLATIDINVPIDLVEDDLILEEPNKEEIERLFTELEFKTLAKRVLGTEIEIPATAAKSAPTASTSFDLFNQGATTTATKIEVSVDEEATPSNLSNISNTPHEYILLETDEQLQNVLNELLQQPEVCFDTETSSLDKIDNNIVGFSFSYKTHHGYYVACSDNFEEAKRLLNIFKPVFESETIIKILQNVKFDLSILRMYGLDLKGPIFDTMLAHYLIEPDLRHGMDFLSGVYLNYEPISIETLIGKKGKNQLSMRDVEVEKVKEYAVEDTDITYQLKQKLAPQLEACEAGKLLLELEQPLVPVLANMEQEGVKINKQFLNDYSVELAAEIEQLEKRIIELAGVDFNIASPKQLGEVLFDHLKLDPKAKKTKTGQYQTGEDVLQTLNEHEIVRCILEVRQLQKLKSTYVDALPELINATTGRLHTSFNQAVAATGRLSSNNPNLQNIPIRTDKGREVRKAFIARNEEYVLLSADYSQIELRIIASMANEEAMIDAFKQGIDIHTATAARVYGIDVKEVTPEQRRNAKAVNFGIIYGQSAFGLSQSLGIPRKEAAIIIDEYWKQYPNIKNYMNITINTAKEHGYVQTLMGRRRYLRDINSANFTVRGFAERNAINAPIQGSAADMIKLAMINIHNRMQKESNLKSKMILQVHDELLFDVYKPEVEYMKQLVKEEMEKAMPLQVPVIVETGIGDNWLEAH